jgi:hypothetical protein
MKRKKILLFVVACILLCLVVLREAGLVDINLYKSMLSISQSSNKTRTNSGQEKHFSYHLTIKHNNETLYSDTYSHNNLPAIDIEATLFETNYSGNSVLPFFKNYKMTYQCEFKTTNSPIGHTVDGMIDGVVTAKVHGLCSHRKAKELTFEGAKKQLISYFQKQLNL